MDFASVIPASSRREPEADVASLSLEHERLGEDAFASQRLRIDLRTIASAMVAAAAAHACLLLALSLPEDDRVGARGIDLDAISVEVSFIDASALETRTPDRAKASGTSMSAEIHNGAPEAKPAIGEHQDGAPQERPEKPEAQVMAPDDPALEAERPANPAPSSDTVSEPPGGGQVVVAISSILPAAASGAALSSVGEMQIYSISVVETLAKSRPRAQAGMEKGTVRVVFEIATNGKAINVRISKSSAVARIDRLVVEAVETTSFPPPPAGATVAQRTYELPYVFR